ncbi:MULTISPECIES: hypothetical protein [unclassified Arenibacter]|uniref:hypothetical protein n=1 Tax=unclassified Arenibacter TaxID=2615047 RepID=UPI0011C0CD0C|nr:MULTISPECIES: hypothetical protein [unclassified Arenibacter]
MYKVVLIILAMVVNELAAGYDESKLVDDCLFICENQLNAECKVASEMFVETYWYREDWASCLPVYLEPQ